MAKLLQASSKQQKRVHLSLERKMEVIKFTKRNPGKGVRDIAEAIGNIGKTQVAAILKQKESVLAAHESNVSISKKTNCK